MGIQHVVTNYYIACFDIEDFKISKLLKKS